MAPREILKFHRAKKKTKKTNKDVIRVIRRKKKNINCPSFINTNDMITRYNITPAVIVVFEYCFNGSVKTVIIYCATLKHLIERYQLVTIHGVIE